MLRPLVAGQRRLAPFGIGLFIGFCVEGIEAGAVIGSRRVDNADHQNHEGRHRTSTAAGARQGLAD